MPKPSVAALRSSQQIIIGLVVCVLVMVALILSAGSYWLHRPQVSSLVPEIVFDPIIAHQTWRNTVITTVPTITSSSSDSDVQHVIDSILALRVTAGDRDGQLQIILTLNARLRHEAGADQRLVLLIQRLNQQP